MTTKTLWITEDKQYIFSKCIDTYGDYDGGTWYHIWDDTNKCIIFEDDDYNEVMYHFESLGFVLTPKQMVG